MANVYAKLFLQEDKANTDKILHEIGEGKGIMDLVLSQAKALQPSLLRADKEKIEEYFESVRETERRLVKSESWVYRAKPQAGMPTSKDPASGAEILTQLRNVCDMTYLAFEPSTVPLSNLYVSVLNQFGLPDTAFGTSTGSLRWLDLI